VLLHRLVLFDIDGTLLELQACENAAYLRAFADCYGITGLSDDWSRYRFRTDIGIAREILENHFRRSCTEMELETVLSAGELLLRAALSDTGFRPQIIPDARRMLEVLAEQEKVHLGLVTANLARWARMRLESAGLWRHFHGGAFAEDGDDKSAILRTALARYRTSASQLKLKSIVYVGDQVADACAARELGIPFVGLAHRPYRLSRLREIGVEPIYEDYTDLDAFLRHLRQLWER
jgi:phosphoglycolate phosphatase